MQHLLSRILLSMVPLLLVLQGEVARAQVVTPPRSMELYRSNIRPELTISPAKGEITIDGNTEDAGWADAARATTFTEYAPGVIGMPKRATEVLVTYDSRALYFAFICNDYPEEIRASLHDRDQGLDDDGVRVMLDTWGNSDWYYDFGCNALGVQNDNVVSSLAPRPSHTLLFESATRIGPGGYSVEIALPFSSINFPRTGPQTWRINFLRVTPRESRREDYWGAIDRDNPCFACQFGSLTGLDITTNYDEHPLQLQPEVASSLQVQPYSTGATSNAALSPSIAAAYHFSPSITASALFRPEAIRSGSGGYLLPNNRSTTDIRAEEAIGVANITDGAHQGIYELQAPDLTIGATIRGDRTSLAWSSRIDKDAEILFPGEQNITAITSGNAISNSVDGTWSLQEGTWFRGSLTDIRWEKAGGWDRLSGGATVRFADNYYIAADALWELRTESNDSLLFTPSFDSTFAGRTHTTQLDGESYSGGRATLLVARRTDDGSFGLAYERVTPTAIGSAYPGNGQHYGSFYARQTFRPINEGIIDRVTPSLGVSVQKNDGSDATTLAISGEIQGVLRPQIDLSLWYYTSGTTNDLSYTTMQISTGMNLSEFVRGNISVSRNSQSFDAGKRYSVLTLALAAELHPLRSLEVLPSLSLSSSKQSDTGSLNYTSRSTSAALDARWYFRRDLFIGLGAAWRGAISERGSDQRTDNGIGLRTEALYRLNAFSTISLNGTMSIQGYGRNDGTAGWYIPTYSGYLRATWLFEI